jgi:hypothetical protein
MPNPSLRFALLAAAGLALGTSACGPSTPTATPDQVAQTDRAAVEAVLQGATWQLVSWRPDEQLEAMFETLLVQQYATMLIHFKDGRLLADSGTMHVNRAYVISNAVGSQFTLVTTDDSGTSLRTNAQIAADGNSVDFRGTSDPWRGEGKLRKTQ